VPGAKIATITELVTATAKAWCAWEFRCCTAAQITQQNEMRYKTEAECLPFKELELRPQVAVARLTISERRAELDEEAATACVAAFEARRCLDFSNPFPPVNLLSEVPACQRLLIGKTGVGEPCWAADECARGSRCVTGGSSTGGAGGFAGFGGFDEPKVPSPSVRGVCVPYQKPGAICNGDHDCDGLSGIYCRRSDFKCARRSGLLEPCAYTTDLDGRNPHPPLLIQCDESQKLYCDPAARVCKKLPVDGETCAPFHPSTGSPYCDPDPALELMCIPSGGILGTCHQPGALGEICGGTTFPPCGEGLGCLLANNMPGSCQPLPGVGQICSHDGLCLAPARCDGTTFSCVMPGAAPIGAPCGAAADCESLLCFQTLPGGPTCQPQESIGFCTGAPGGGGGGGGPIGTGGFIGGVGGRGGGFGGRMGSVDAGAPGGSFGTGGFPGTGGSGGGPMPDCFLDLGTTPETIDDLEDGDTAILPSQGRMGGWYTYNDGSGGTQIPEPMTLSSAATIPEGSRCQSFFAFHTVGGGFTKWGAGVGILLAPPTDTGAKQPYDASAFAGVAFWIRLGDSGPVSASVRFNMTTAQTSPEGGGCDPAVASGPTACHDHFGVQLMLAPFWTRVIIPFSQLSQQGWGRASPVGFDRGQLLDIQFQVTAGAPFDFWIDDITFLR
jgi:hypothetical protein